MSELQMVNGSELQSIELSDAELQSIAGGVTALGALGLALLEGAATAVVGAYNAYSTVKGGYALPTGKWA